jgi:hypothetical protein
MATNIDKVQQLYVAYFNRPADVAGLNFWVGALAKGVTVDTIAASFATQAEYKALFAGKGAESIINTVYLNMFGRNAEKAALDFYGPLVQNGTISIDKVVTDIVKGAQGTDATAYNNKVTAAKAFTAALDTAGNEADRIAYATGTDAVLSIAKTWLATVTTDASLTTALAAVEATVDSMGGLGNVGQTFTMTQGLDTILGTAADDTINAFAFNGTTGTNVTTLNSVDTVDGGTGVDSLFIEVKDANGTDTTNLNGTIVGTFKNIEKITIDNTAADLGAALNTVDATKFVGATNITQVTNAAAVTGLAATTTATFKGVNAGVTVTAANGTANIGLDNYGEGNTVTVNGSSLAAVNVSGSVKDTNADGSVAATVVAVTSGKDVQAVSLNTAVKTNLTVTDNAGSTKFVSSVDASASTGAVTYAGTAKVVTITTGAGGDTVTLMANTNAASGTTAAVGATVTTNAGNDKITVDTANAGLTSVTGATTVNAGAGNDTVTVTTRSSGVLTVNLGDGNDSFTSSVDIGATDVIDAGAGSDKLLLKLVGAANIGAFSNFDSFDAIGLAKSLDVDILATKNTVTEFVTTGDVGASAVLTNVGAGVGYRVTGDADANSLTLTQKTAGDITLTMDVDETEDADTSADAPDAVVVTNATGIKVVFDADFADEAQVDGDNVAHMTVNSASNAVKTVTVESGGDNAMNLLTLGNSTALTSITVTGAALLAIEGVTGAGSTKLATIDASAATGGLVATLDSVIDGGTIKLGSGTDEITASVLSTQPTGTAPGIESIVGFEKAAAAAIGTDATAAAAAISAADALHFGSASQVANALSVTGGAVTAKGVLTFTGAGPSTLDAALVIANAAADAAGEVLVFEYLGNSYVFNQTGAAADIVVKLTGVTGITNLLEDTNVADNFVIV